MRDGGSSGGDKSALSDITSSAESASGAVDDIGTNAKKAKKQLNGLRGIDILHNTTTSDDASVNSNSGGGIGGIDFGDSSIADTVKKANEELNPLFEKFKEFSTLFKESFKIGLGNANFSGIKSAISSIGKSIQEIWSSSKVSRAVSKWANAVVIDLGKWARKFS